MSFESAFCTIFNNTLSSAKEARREAEEQLIRLTTEVPEANIALFQFAATPASGTNPMLGGLEVERMCRLAAATRLKNMLCRSSWHRTAYFNGEGKRFVKQKLLPSLCNPQIDHRVYRLFAVCLDNVLSYDWPSQWPELVPSVQAIFAQALGMRPSSEAEAIQQLTAIKTALLAVRYCARRAMGVVDGSHHVANVKLLDSLASDFIGNVCTSMGLMNTQGHSSPFVLDGQHIALKALSAFLNSKLPKVLCEVSAFRGLYESLTSFTESLNGQLQTLLGDSQRREELSQPGGMDSNPWLRSYFKVLKWLWAIHKDIMAEYSNVSDVEKRARKAATALVEEFAPRLLGNAIQLFALHDSVTGTSGSRLTSKGFSNALDFVACCAACPALRPRLVGVAPTLLGQHLVPRLAFTAEDYSLWRVDPEEYIRRQNISEFNTYDEKRLAMIVVLDVIRILHESQSALLPSFVAHVVARVQANENPVEVDGLLYFVAHLTDRMQKVCFPEPSTVEELLLSIVVPFLRSPHGFLRAKALQCLAHNVNRVPWSSVEALNRATLEVLAALQDPELPVRMQAASSFLPFVEHQANRELLEPRVVSLVQQYLAIMNQMDSDATISTLTAIVEHFGTALSQWAVELCEVLLHKFGEMHKQVVRQAAETLADANLSWKAEDDGRVLEDMLASTDAIDEMLNLIKTLVMAVPKDRSDVLMAIQVKLNPLFYAILSRTTEDLGCLSAVSELVTELFKHSSQVHPVSWNLIPAFHKVLMDGCLDYFGEVLCAIDNLVSADPKGFFQVTDPTNGTPGFNVGLIAQMTSHVFAESVQGHVTSDRVLSTAAMAVDLVHLAARGCGLRHSPLIEAFLPQLVTPPITVLAQRRRNPTLTVLLANCVLSGFAAHAEGTLNILQSMGATAYFMQQYSAVIRSEDLPLRLYDRHLFIIAVLSVLETLVKQPSRIGSVITAEALCLWVTDAVGFSHKNAEEYDQRIRLKAERDEKIRNGELDEEWSDVSDDEGGSIEEGEEETEEGWSMVGGSEDDEPEDDANISARQQLAKQAREAFEAEESNLDDPDVNLLDDVELVSPIDAEDSAQDLFSALQYIAQNSPPLWGVLSSVAAATNASEVLPAASRSFAAARAVNLV